MKHLATAAFEAQSVSQSVSRQMMLIQTSFRWPLTGVRAPAWRSDSHVSDGDVSIRSNFICVSSVGGGEES